MKRIFIAGIPIDIITIPLLHETIGDVIRNNEKKVFLHANARLIELANTKEEWLKIFFNEQDKYVMCDGSGVQLAARIQKKEVPVKIPYNIWLWSFFEFAAQNKFRVYLLGADEKTISVAVKNAVAHSPDLSIKGFRSGYFNKEKNSEENQLVISGINEANCDILIVGFGMPIQEKWVKDNMHSLNVKTIFTCGGAFDFISGNKPVAPLIVRQLHLEWLFRFFLEPIRLFERAIVSNMRFVLVLLKNRK